MKIFFQYQFNPVIFVEKKPLTEDGQATLGWILTACAAARHRIGQSGLGCSAQPPRPTAPSSVRIGKSWLSQLGQLATTTSHHLLLPAATNSINSHYHSRVTFDPRKPCWSSLFFWSSLTKHIGKLIKPKLIKRSIGVVHILRNHFWGSWETPPPHVIL